MPSASLRTLAPLGLLLAGLCGCKPEDEIRTYTVPKPTQPAAAEESPAPPKVRLLGAVIPTPTDSRVSWFIKLVGPVEAVTAAEKDFDAFLSSLKPGDEKTPLAWTVPAGWKADTHNPNRIVTVTGGPPAAPLQMYISLPFGGSVGSNVNRWRTLDLGLKAVSEADARRQAVESKVGMLTFYRVDLKGPGSSKMGGPMVGN